MPLRAGPNCSSICAEPHPGKQADPGGLGQQAYRGQIAKPAHGKPVPEQRRAGARGGEFAADVRREAAGPAP